MTTLYLDGKKFSVVSVSSQLSVLSFLETETLAWIITVLLYFAFSV